MLNCAFSVLYEISCVFGMQYPFKLWNMFFIISDHRGGKNVNISLQTSHQGQFDDDSCCHSAFITFQYSGHECYSKSTRWYWQLTSQI